MSSRRSHRQNPDVRRQRRDWDDDSPELLTADDLEAIRAVRESTQADRPSVRAQRAPAPQAPTTSREEGDRPMARPGYWPCPSCGWDNHPTNDLCGKCGTRNPALPPATTGTVVTPPDPPAPPAPVTPSPPTPPPAAPATPAAPKRWWILMVTRSVPTTTTQR
jgi:hypothetical protein